MRSHARPSLLRTRWNRTAGSSVQDDMNDPIEPISTWLSQQIDDLLAWDRELWDVDPPEGWDPTAHRFTD